MIRTTDMNQVAVYWQPGIPDGTGSFDFTSVIPVEIMCRFQDQQNLFRDAQGREVRTSRVAYVDREVVVGGFIAPGSLAEFGLRRDNIAARPTGAIAAGSAAAPYPDPLDRRVTRLERTADRLGALETGRVLAWC